MALLTLTLMKNLTATLLLLSEVGGSFQPAPPAGSDAATDGAMPPEAVEPAPAPEAADNPDETTVDAVLTKLERGAEGLRAFTADIVYESYEDLLGKREVRTGELIYHVGEPAGDAPGVKSFAVLFDSLIVNQRRTERLRHYVFHDRWLAEIDHEARQFIKREIVAPGQTLDPLKLGEGPVPLPIGQAKDDVLARFDVSLIERSEHSLLKDIDDAYGLLLVPKPESPEAEEFKRIELFYDRAALIPVGINAIETNDNRKAVRLRNVARNPELTEAQFARLSIKEPDAASGWSIDVRPWQAKP